MVEFLLLKVSWISNDATKRGGVNNKTSTIKSSKKNPLLNLDSSFQNFN